MSEHTLPAAVGVVNPDLKMKQPWALSPDMRSGRVAIVRAHGYTRWFAILNELGPIYHVRRPPTTVILGLQAASGSAAF